jgi:hypothetical protein
MKLLTKWKYFKLKEKPEHLGKSVYFLDGINCACNLWILLRMYMYNGINSNKNLTHMKITYVNIFYLTLLKVNIIINYFSDFCFIRHRTCTDHIVDAKNIK